jgi:hypothetical protein
MVQTRMVQTRNKLKFDELDKLKELISERRSNKKIKIKQKQETENKRKLRLVKKQNAQRKECLCGKKQVNDKSNKDYWISC